MRSPAVTGHDGQRRAHGQAGLERLAPEMGHDDHGVGDHLAVGILGNILDKRLVDLKDVQGKALQVSH